MATFRRDSIMPVSPAVLFAWHSREGAFERLSPPWQEVVVTDRTGSIRDGDTITIRLKQGPVWLTWKAVHEACIPNEEFTDRMTTGPFAEWVHRHYFAPGPSMGTSELRDIIQYRMPAGALGEAFLSSKVTQDLTRTFRFRHERTRLDLVSHNRHAESPRLRIGVTDWDLPMARQLLGFLSTGGHTVFRIGDNDGADGKHSKNRDWLDNLVSAPTPLPPPGGLIDLDCESGRFLSDQADQLDVIVALPAIQLAPIVKLSPKARDELFQYGIEKTRSLANAIKRLKRPPPRVISLSDAAIYGRGHGSPVSEASAPIESTVTQYLRECEASFASLGDTQIRTVHMRIGRTVGEAVSCPFPLAWISDDDLCDAVLHLADSTVTGPVLVCAPNPGSKRDFATDPGTLGALSRELAGLIDSIGGSKESHTLKDMTPAASSTKLVESGFTFRYPTLAEAARFQLGVDPS